MMILNITFMILAIVFFICGYHLQKNPNYSLWIEDQSLLALINRLFPHIFYILSFLMLTMVLVDLLIPTFSHTFRMYMLYLLALIIIGAAIYSLIQYIIYKE